MYNINNLSNEIFLLNHKVNKLYYLGNKEYFINELATKVHTYNYLDPERWDFPFFDDLNITGKDIKVYYINESIKISEDNYFHFLEKKIDLREYTYYDGYGNSIDIRAFKNDIIKKVLNGFNENKYYKNYYQIRSKYNSGNHSKNKMPKIKSIRIFNSIPEYKKFVKGKEKDILPWWDEPYRRVESNWKYQNKTKKQWGQNVKSMKSIRKYKNNDEEFDLDLLLLEEFEGKL